MKLRFFEWRLNMYSSEYKIQRKAIQSIDITETDRTYVVCLNTSYGPISIYNPGTKISILALLPSLDEFKNYVFQSIVLSNDDIITIHTTFYITDLALKYISEIIYDPDTCGMQLEFYVHLTNVIGSTKLYMSDRNVSIHLSQMVNRSTTINHEKQKLSITIMDNPFSGYQEKDIIGGMFTEQELENKKRYAKAKVKDYLETNDFETLIDKLK